jgi:hypothetical protein
MGALDAGLGAGLEAGLDAGPRLGDLDEAERYQRFDALQARMASVWAAMGQGHGDESVVVVPSVSLDKAVASSGTMMQAMEERALFLLLLLRQPRLRMIYVTSMPISRTVIEYYLGLLPGVVLSHAAARLTLVSVGDASGAPLSEKLLARPRVLSQIADLIPNRARCHLIPYTTTELERDVAITLGIPMYGADPRLSDLGSKTGCRQLFRRVGVAHPAGREDLHGLADIASAVREIRRERADVTEVIVKLNEGVSGEGNALVDLRGLPADDAPGSHELLAERIRAMALESSRVPFEAYVAKFEEAGGIVEQRIQGVELRSPSVQLRILPDRTIELLSTHDQLLGGPSMQQYLGCVFPADRAYAGAISREAMVIAEELAQAGVLGRFAVDFVVVQDDAGAWSPYAIELNLRKGGTTHPFLTLQYLTGGAYDVETATFRTPGGAARYLVATDHLESPALRALSLDDLFDAVTSYGLQFDKSDDTGVVFHMMSCLTEVGRLGLTAVAESPERTWELYQRAERILLEEAERALRQQTLPS